VNRATIAFVFWCAAGACGRADESPGESDPLAQYTAAERANPSANHVLSGVNLWAYCNSLGYPTVGYRRGYIEGPSGAYDNWVCQRGTEQLAPKDSVVVDMNAACRWQNGREDVLGRASDPNHAWSWSCYRAMPGGQAPDSAPPPTSRRD